MRIINWLRQNKAILALFFIEILLFSLNYIPGTYFIGWDNLFPELNFSENIRRSFFAVWEEYRGLGILDGMSFAANLPHYIFLFFASFVIPQNLLRYFFIFLMHFLGGVGMYFLLSELLTTSRKKIVSFLGSLFYLFNLATIQMFFAPYEVFAVHFAFLPLLLLFAIKFLKTGEKKNLIWFAVLSLLSVPQAHVPTMFIVYLLALSSVIAFYLLENKNAVKKALIIFVLTFLINSFWELPYIYSTITNAQTIANSKINQMSNEDIFLLNKAKGNFQDTALMKGFWLDYTDLQSHGNNNYIMPAWRTHTQNLPFLGIGFLFFGMSLFASIVIIKRRSKNLYPFLALFLFSFLMLGNDIPVLGSVFQFLSDHIPYFSQVFRFVFTKFSILYSFTFSILLAFTLAVLFEKIKFKYSWLIFSSVFLIFLAYYSSPVFKGQFLYDNLRVKIPKEYFQLVAYFKNQNKNQRIATLPQPSFWGWTYTNWGYRGSGFIWFGFSQPSLDGAFYPWSRQNENYYWELEQAIYSSNKTSFESVLQKYQIDWVVIDNSVISPYSSRAPSLDKIEGLIEDSSKLKLASKFGTINVYKVNFGKDEKNFVSIKRDLPKVSPSYSWNNFDYAYLQNGDYVSQNSEREIFYPFRSLFTGKEQDDSEFKIKDFGSYFSFQTKIPKSLSGAALIIPSVFDEELTEIDKNNLDEANLKLPQVFLDGEIVLGKLEISSQDTAEAKTEGETNIYLPYINEGNLEVRIPKIKGYYSYVISGNDLLNRDFKNCNPFAQGTYSHFLERKGAETFLNLESIGSNNCFSFDLPNLSQRLSYLISVESKHSQGKSLLFSVINKNYEKPDFEIYLPKSKGLLTSYFIIPPMDNYGLGYNLYFDNASIGNVKTTNALGKINVNPIPHRFLSSLRIERGSLNNLSKPDVKFAVKHPNPSLFEIELEKGNLNNQTLILSQSFDQGWKSYRIDNANWLKITFPFLFGKELKSHTLVNNWENGWTLENDNSLMGNNRLVIIYWPQYLEYSGMALMVLTFAYLTFKMSKKSYS